MPDPRFPIMGEPSTWGAFDPADPFNRSCETERKLLLAYLADRTRKRQCDQMALLTAMFMGTVQLFAAMASRKMLTEEDRAALRELLEFAMVAGVDSFDHGETKQ